MAKLTWDETGSRLYETGTKHGVLYPLDPAAADPANSYPRGIAWNGLTGFSEEPDGGDPEEIYADDIKYLSIRSTEDFGGTITAYTYPDEFMVCDGSAEPINGVYASQQNRKPFGFSYVTTVGNDKEYNDYGYKIHLIYGCTASPSSRDYQTINDSPEAIEFSWDIDTVPVSFGPNSNLKPTSHLTIDSTKFTTDAAKAKLTAFETVLYGGENTEARLPLPAEVITLLTVTQSNP